MLPGPCQRHGGLHQRRLQRALQPRLLPGRRGVCPRHQPGWELLLPGDVPTRAVRGDSRRRQLPRSPHLWWLSRGRGVLQWDLLGPRHGRRLRIVRHRVRDVRGWRAALQHQRRRGALLWWRGLLFCLLDGHRVRPRLPLRRGWHRVRQRDHYRLHGGLLTPRSVGNCGTPMAPRRCRAYTRSTMALRGIGADTGTVPFPRGRWRSSRRQRPTHGRRSGASHSGASSVSRDDSCRACPDRSP